MVKLVNKHFKTWFNRADVPERLPKAVIEAEAAARLEMAQLLP
jgi:hypothetical protein